MRSMGKSRGLWQDYPWNSPFINPTIISDGRAGVVRACLRQEEGLWGWHSQCLPGTLAAIGFRDLNQLPALVALRSLSPSVCLCFHHPFPWLGNYHKAASQMSQEILHHPTTGAWGPNTRLEAAEPATLEDQVFKRWSPEVLKPVKGAL